MKEKTKLIPLYNGAVNVSPNCLQDPAVMAALESLSKRNWKAYDHQRVCGTFLIDTKTVE